MSAFAALMRRTRPRLVGLGMLALVMAVILWPQPSPVSATGVAAISAGTGHSCAVTNSGGVKCWGNNSAGQLGSITTELCGPVRCSTTPIDVPSLSSGVVAVAAGLGHTCALTTAGGVKCWGANTLGQLGDGQSCGVECTVPVDAVGLASGVAALTTERSHTCALTTTGGVKCWGRNDNGQLGAMTSETCGGNPCITTPTDVAGLTSDVTAIAAGAAHTCAVTTAGGVKCLGANGSGQLGDGQVCGTPCTMPVDVSGLGSGVAAVAAGLAHTCALTTAGGVKCWGTNFSGQLGDGQICGTACTMPVDVSGLGSGVATIAVGGMLSCAITTAGSLKCWGFNSLGQVGDGTTTDRLTPVDVLGLDSGVAAIAAGGTIMADHACAVTTGGDVKCWGANYIGQLGDGGICGFSCVTPVDVLVGPKPTPTPTPIPPTPIGGIGTFPVAPGGGPDTGGAAILVAAAVLAGAASMGGAAWYARRRRAG